MDLCGPMRIASINGKHTRSDYFLKRIIVLLQSHVIIIRTDNRTEFKNQILKEYFDSVGISNQASSVITPQQNRVIERRNRTLVEAARKTLIFSRAPLFLWAEAIATACYTQNHSIIHRRFNKTPYELINGKKPYISFLHVFEALCYPKNDREDIRKLGAKGDISFFIGYSADSCAYRVYNQRTKKIIEIMNVTFDELSAMTFKQSSSKLGLQSMTSGQITMHDNYIGGQPSAALRTRSPSEQVIGEPSRPVLTRNQLRSDGDICMYALTVSTMEPKNVKEAMTDPAWIESMQEELLLKKALYGLKQAPRACRPDIVQATYGLGCSGTRSKPTEKHLKEVLKDLSLSPGNPFKSVFWYTKDSGFELTGFSDADYAGLTPLSTAEAEYVSLSVCCAQVLWMRTQLTDYGFNFNKIPIYCDSKSAIAISCNPVQHSRTKHIAVRYHFIKEHVEKGTIELYFVKTDYQLADTYHTWSSSRPIQLFGSSPCQNRRDLPRNFPLDRVEVLGQRVKRKEALHTTLGKKPGSLHNLSVITKMINILKTGHHGPSDARHNPPHPLQNLSTDFCLISPRRSTHFYRLSHSEIVDIEKVAVCSSLRLPNNKCALFRVYEPRDPQKSH
ncbi:retrovirus-related pol polyprotein from transposon TNT 1-94 [Tanacetum coccineum]